MELLLRFRRQFILSTNQTFSFDTWQNLRVGNEAYLSVHPDLEVTKSSSNGKEIILLGFILDPFTPDKTNQEIVDEIVCQSCSFDEIVDKTEPLGGRWAIIYRDNRTIQVFNDPCGQRLVYYFRNDECHL